MTPWLLIGWRWLWMLLSDRVRPPTSSVLTGLAGDVLRSRSQLILENALLRQQVIILRRQVARPLLTNTERRWLVVLASRVRQWQQTLLIVQPDTLLKWHRQLFRHFWRRKSQAVPRPPRVAADVMDLIRQMAQANPLWGAERIQGELRQLDIYLAKRTILKYMGRVHRTTPPSQTWRTFLHNHATHVWACDFLQTYDLFFRAVFVFVIIELGSRRIVHINVMRQPTDAWVAQQMREATPFELVPRFLLCDRDSKYGEQFQRVITGRGIRLLRTPYRAPRANACCERLMGSLRRECLNHLLIVNEGHLRTVMRAYAHYYNHFRPHQGIAQQIPASKRDNSGHGEIVAIPILGGLHHVYRRKNVA